MPRAARLLLSCLLAGVLAGCGSESGSGGADADPATLVPASAALYVEAVVRPEGEQREGAMAAMGKVLRTADPERRLRELIEKEAREEGSDFDYDRDVKPWLGKRAGVTVSDLQADEPSVLIAAAATDTGKAIEAIEKERKRSKEKSREGSYEGIDYRVDGDGMAVGAIEDFLVVGHERLFKQAVDTSKGERSLATSAKYKDALAPLEKQRLGSMYLDFKPLFDAALKEDPEAGRQLQQVKQLFDFEKLAPAGAAFVANGERIAMDVSVKSGGAGALMKQLSLLTGSGSTPLVGELPGDAWLAYGAPNVGESLKAVYDAFAGALGGAAISGRLKQETGLDLQQDVFGWIGDVALFVRGADTAAIDGAVVIQATDPARARSAVTRMIGVATQKLPGAAPRAVELDGAEIAFAIAAPGTPKPVVVAVGGERVVVGYGQAAAEDALDPDAELGDAEPFKRATEALEEKSEPSFYVSMPEVMRLLEAMPDLAGDADFAKVKPYLDTIAAFIVGNQKDGERLRSRSAARLK